MSWLLFMDESGHDHRNTPYEVRGGIALKDNELWPFVQDVQRLELASFGVELHQYKKELKGCKLLDKDRFRFAAQGPIMVPEERRKHCRGFLTKGLEKKPPTEPEFIAYGQACLEMAQGVFEVLSDHKARIFASAIPKNTVRPPTFEADEYLRKDHVYLLERFFYFLEHEKNHGLIVMDEVERTNDRRFVKRLENYFTKTHTGRFRASWIVPTPFFVSSDLTYPIQAADLVIYCVNWGFRLPAKGMDSPTRPEVASKFGPWLNHLQFRGDGYRNGQVFQEFGIVFVPDPYGTAQK